MSNDGGQAVDITQRIDAVTKIDEIRVKSGGIQPPPKSVKIELTARCNLMCKYCATGMRKVTPPEDMNFYFFKKITEDMRISGVEEIGLFYLGEPFMNPELLCMASDWVKNHLGFTYVFLTSNATLASPEAVEALLETGIDSVKWSVNFADEDQFSRFTGRKEELFYRAINNIQNSWALRNRGEYRTKLSASSILYGEDQKAKMDTFLAKEILPYVDRHYWLPLYQMSMYKEHLQKVMGYVPTAGNMGRLDDVTLKPTRKSLPCWSAFTEGHVRADGGLSACCFGSDDKFDMGILDGTNFMRMWNSVKFQNLRKAQLATLTDGQETLRGTPCEVCVAYEK
jgi:sulfatase maturation enzyme AslB (radical SAM superfamily)